MTVTYYYSDAIRLSLVVIFVLFMGLKVSESWLVGEEGWLADYYPDDEGGIADYHAAMSGGIDSANAGGNANNRLKMFFTHRDKPTANGPRCDACRAIAYRLDKAFDFAESHVGITDGNPEMLDELSEKEVKIIASYICNKKTFSDVKPFKFDSTTRLLTLGTETPILYQILLDRMKSGESGSHDLDDSPDSFVLDRFDSFESKVLRGSTAEAKVDWPQRIENHCRYLVMERLRSKEVYEMWLRTSAASYQDFNTFEQFLCFGEYVFGDCLAKSGSEAGGLGPEGPTDPEYWPGGDEKDMPAAKSDQEVTEEENEESTLDPMQNQELIEFEVNFKDWYDSTKAGSRSGSASWSRTGSILPFMSICSFFIVAYG